MSSIGTGTGHSGLANLGNTCFMNSVLQIFSHTKEFSKILDAGTYRSKLNNIADSIILLEWDELRQLMWSQNCVVAPSKFLHTVQRLATLKGATMFTGFVQNDASEFIHFLVQSFHNAIARPVTMTITGTSENATDKLAIQCFDMIRRMYANEYSEVWDIFYGVHISEIVSTATGTVMRCVPEPYFMIDLGLPPHIKNPSIEECFDWYVQGEVLEGDNAWLNELTGVKESVQKRISYWSFPCILVIDIKRFSHRNVKNQCLVTIDIDTLDLSKYAIGYRKESYIYELYGICNHSGSVHGGHYTATVRTASGEWHAFNDTHVTQIHDVSKLITPQAYCLFYRKKST